ncbi:hypothetical protein ACWD69_09470 [Micromonospora chokoriensis]
MTDQPANAQPGDDHVNLTEQRLTPEARAALYPFLARYDTAPRRVPTMAERVGCGHTPEQHRHTADNRSKDRAIRELTAELVGARERNAALAEAAHDHRVTASRALNERDRLSERIARMADDLDSTEQVAAYREGVIVAQAEQLRRNGTLLCKLRDLDEQRDRAWAEHDTAPEVTPVEADCSTCKDTGLAVIGLQFNGQPVHADCPDCGIGAEKRAEADAEAEEPPGSVTPHAQDLTDRLAVALTEARRTHDGSGVRPGTLERWRLLLAEYAATADQREGAEQALRDRVEHAIRERLAEAWPNLGGDVFVHQLAAVAAVAAVQTLTGQEG